MIFSNESKQTVKVNWMDHTHLPVEYCVLEPGKKHKQSTYTTHTWVVTDREGNLWNWITCALLTIAVHCHG